MDVLVHEGAHQVLLLQHQRHGQDQVGGLGRVRHEGVADHDEVEAVQGLGHGPGLGELGWPG